MEKTTKMDKNVKKLWLKGLRGDKFIQSSGRLKDEYGYCCLGVLCEVMERGYKPGSEFPSTQTLKFAGLSKFQAKKLAMMNDHEHMTFKGIANWIEKNL